MYMKGRTILKVVGIIMIIFGAIGVAVALSAFALSGLVAAGASALGMNAGIIMFSSVLAVIGGAVELIFGIMAVRFCAVPEKAKLLFTLGIIMIAISAISLIFSFVAYSGAVGSSAATGVVGFLLPILYTLGGRLNMTSLPPQNPGQPPYGGGQPPQNPGQPPQA